ncbi:uncharacterized protein LOC115985057 [Quercus lobata]|uniref:uncharacterized protein LOC115985057 n=1 Tax=Quercus lobata TaxID=97700 RepID=UPI0012451312|nr:uncharacterized protein LOC115985057 [Quercus lobata]
MGELDRETIYGLAKGQSLWTKCCSKQETNCKSLRVLRPEQGPHRQDSSSQWQPLPSSVCKINFDSALFMKEQRAGIGVAIQNENGLIMVSSSQQIPLPGTVVEVEALAARKALELALDCGLDRVILEGDCEILMKTLQTTSKSLAQFGKIAEDIRVYASMFQDISFSHVRRNCNSVAHSLARRAILSPHFLVWMENVPPDVEPVFQADLRSLP